MERLLNIIKKYIPKKLFRALQPAYHFILAWLSALWYGWPSEKLIVIGVTGTTGKTTSVYLMAKVLESAGYKVGYTSTAMFNDGRKEWLNDKKMTMAGRFFVQKILKQMVKNNCQYAIVETTSEGITQFRHRFINYDILIFTGLYPEHIEAHGSFNNYKKAKGKLFAHLKKCKTKYINDEKAVIRADSGIKKIDLDRVKKTIIANADDEEADYFLGFWAEEKFIYTNKNEFPPKADQPLAEKTNKTSGNLRIIDYGNIKSDNMGVSFIAGETKIQLRLLGEFNATNAMNAVCLGFSQGFDSEKIKKGLENVKGMPGRMEMITSPRPSPLQGEGVGFTIIVDYAFEPKVVAKLYEVVSMLPREKVIHVLGSAGGGRDTSRRPELGKLAGEQADVVIVTNEDPYDDDPQIIVDQVAEGAIDAGKILEKNLFKILDRRQAIIKALTLADKGDIVLVTGKGSEQAICVGSGNKIPWDDRKVVREEIRRITHNA